MKGQVIESGGLAGLTAATSSQLTGEIVTDDNWQSNTETVRGGA